MFELAITLGIAAAAVVVYAFVKAPTHLRIPLAVFNGIYLLTSVIGAILVTNPDFQFLWSVAAGGADVDWLLPGDTSRYWILLLTPFLLVNLVALIVQPWFRPMAVAVARNLGMQVSQPAVALVGAAMIAYCVLNLAQHGYLGIGLLSAENVGFYRENIQLRAAMAQDLGSLHFGVVYMALPAVCVTALVRAVETGRATWWMLFGLLTVGAVLMYMTTLTKSNLLIFVIALGVAAFTLRMIRVRGIVVAAGLSLLLLSVQEALLAGSGLIEFAATLSNVVLRLSTAIPFYVEVFPQQEAFVGIDYGLGWFGIGPDVAPNLVVFNYMFPSITWVQGAAPAAAHISAYAQAGLWFSILTMVLVGVVIALFGALGKAARSGLARSAFVGGGVMCYYATQTDLVGTFNHSYGYKWWLLGLFAIAGTEIVLRWLLSVPRPALAKQDAL
jgi:hypothetical protein